MVLHVALDQLLAHGSPKDCWCYRDESCVGSAKKVAGNSKHPSTVEYVVMMKMRIRTAATELRGDRV